MALVQRVDVAPDFCRQHIKATTLCFASTMSRRELKISEEVSPSTNRSSPLSKASSATAQACYLIFADDHMSDGDDGGVFDLAGRYIIQ